MRPLAEQITFFFSEFYRICRIDIEVPYPESASGVILNDSYLKMRLFAKQSLYFRPPTSIAPFVLLMDALTGSDSWTSSNIDTFKHVSWENCEQGYWFWADFAYSKEKMVREHEVNEENAKTLLSLEEYVIFHYSTTFSNPLIRDEPNALMINTWLRSKSHGRFLAARQGHIITVGENRPGYLRYSARHV